MLHEFRARHKLWGSGFFVHDHCRPYQVEIPAPQKASPSGSHRAGLRHRVRAGKGGADTSIRMGAGSGSPDGAYKMALNLIEKVAKPAGKPDSRKRKRSEDTASGSGSQHGRAATATGTSSETRPHIGTSPTASTATTARTGQRTRGTHLPRTHNSTTAAPAQFLAGDPPAIATVRWAVAEGEGASGASAAVSRRIRKQRLPQRADRAEVLTSPTIHQSYQEYCSQSFSSNLC